MGGDIGRKGAVEVTGAGLPPAVAPDTSSPEAGESDSTNDLVNLFICKVGTINPTRRRAMCVNLTV